MSTSKLVWSMVVRGCGWTTWVGAVLGAGYGIVLFAAMMLSLAEFGPNNGALPLFFVVAYAVLVAALFGAVVAGAIGFVFGPIGGLLCGLMTRLFFMPQRSERFYRILARFAGGIYGALALVVAVRVISTSGFAPPIQTFREITMLYVFPALLGGLAGLYISRPVIDLYLRKSTTAADTTTPPEAVSSVKPA